MTDPDNGDFTLQATSPCINAGTDVNITTDYAGNPIVGAPDIGAYEFQRMVRIVIQEVIKRVILPVLLQVIK
jgi:hypothetical protein